ncbi:hypothetical protein ACOMHN_010744 [Nucella lapillus]
MAASQNLEGSHQRLGEIPYLQYSLQSGLSSPSRPSAVSMVTQAPPTLQLQPQLISQSSGSQQWNMGLVPTTTYPLTSHYTATAPHPSTKRHTKQRPPGDEGYMTSSVTDSHSAASAAGDTFGECPACLVCSAQCVWCRL